MSVNPRDINTDVSQGNASQAVGSTGFIPLPLQSWRLVVSNEVPVIAVASGNGGTLASDTAPKLIRISTSTDKKLSLSWAASSSIEIFNEFQYPPDLDDAQPVVIHMRAKSGGATDTPVLTVGYFEGIGDTNAGSASAAISASVVDKTVVIAASDVGAYPNSASVTITPGAHTTDTVVITETWVTYTKKENFF